MSFYYGTEHRMKAAVYMTSLGSLVEVEIRERKIAPYEYKYCVEVSHHHLTGMTERVTKGYKTLLWTEKRFQSIIRDLESIGLKRIG